MKNYRMFIQGFDFGPFVTKLIIDWDEMPAAPKPEDFTISVTKQASFFEPALIAEDEREVTAAYMDNTRLILELEVHPSKQIGNALRVEKIEEGPGKFYVGNQWAEPYGHKLTWKGEAVPLNCTGVIKDIVDLFESGSFTGSDGVHLQYAHFTPPEAENSKHPLIIWLHGAGEGSWFGTQPVDIAIMGNKVVAFADEPMQTLMEGAYVLVPQAPTMWMDDGSGAYTQDGTTKYETVLAELIEGFISHQNVDASRVYIGGCSNGGFMTVKMLFARPNLFAAAFPVCQGYRSEWITDEMIGRIKHIPIWQIHAKNDALLPSSISETVHNRLLEAGAANVVCTVFDEMVDISGKWTDEAGRPWVYDGHWSWIHVFNNDVFAVVDGNDISLFEWLAAQKRG